VFLKRCTRKKSGKEHVYWQLVESVKTPRGPRHRVVAYLGELSNSERGGWARLANMLDGRAAEEARQLSLLDSCDLHDEPVPAKVSVKLDGVCVDESRDFGDVDAKTVPSPDGEETFVLCRSRDRVEKEKAMHQRQLEHVEAGLQSIQRDFARAKKPRDRSEVDRRIGGLLANNTRVRNAFKITLGEAPEEPAGLRLTYERVEKWHDWATLSDGCYMLRTNLTGKEPDDLWRMYIQLTDVEEAFRSEKTELNIRPIWHQTEARVQGHILFSFLAYAMWKTLQTWMERAGLGRGVRTVLEEFARIKATDIVLPTDTGREVRLRCVTKPDAAQRALIDRLGIAIPERVGRPHWVRNTVTDPVAGSLDFEATRRRIGR
jgi:hypothetical protein